MALSDVYALIDSYGHNCGISRLSPPGAIDEKTVKMVRRRAQEMPMVGDVSQYDVQFMVRHSSLGTAGFTPPPKKGDRITSHDEVFVVETVEPMHDEIGGIGGYRLWCQGH